VKDYPKWDYQEYPKTLPRQDFWGQVRRTQFGRPVSEAEIGAIVRAIREGLALRADDVVLDLACGNGALSARLFDACRGLLGVDLSAYLIEIAQESFARPPDFQFVCQDVLEYVFSEPAPERFRKAMCYAGMQYLVPGDLVRLLDGLWDRFRGLEVIFLGNVPDREKAELFFAEGPFDESLLREPKSQIGVWWSRDELGDVAAVAGWGAEFSQMSEGVFNSRYRYDAVLTRRPRRS